MNNKTKTALEFTPTELVSKLMGIEGHPFGAIKFFNEVTDLVGGKKTFAQFGGKLYKYMRLNGMTNIDYVKAITNRMEREGLNPTDFQHEEHLWMKRYYNENGKLTTLGYHKADEDLPINERRWYVAIYFVSGKQVFETTYYDSEFKEVPMEVIKPLLRDKTSSKQVSAGLTGDNQVVYRNFKIESIREIAINGEVISVVA